MFERFDPGTEVEIGYPKSTHARFWRLDKGAARENVIQSIRDLVTDPLAGLPLALARRLPGQPQAPVSCPPTDTTSSLTGLRTVWETRSSDALCNVPRSLSDAAGRTLQSIDALGKITAFTYDPAGNQLSVLDPNGVGQSRLYDALGRDIFYTDTARAAMTNAYDAAGNTRPYDDGGRMTASSYINGSTKPGHSNADNTLASISFSSAAVGYLGYGFDANKNKTSETIGGRMSGYGFTVGWSGHDDEDCLVNWHRADTNLVRSWDLSLVGNWDTYTENASAQSRTHGPTYELLTVASQSVTHDAKGNMTLIPAVLRPGSDPLNIKWDFENKLIAADTDNDSVDDVFYRIAALGRRDAR